MKSAASLKAKWCLGLAALSLASLGHANLLTNPGFDVTQSIVSPWAASGTNGGSVNFVKPADNYISPDGAAVYTGGEALSTGGLTYQFDLIEGGQYTLEFFVKSVDAAGAPIAPSVLNSFSFGNNSFTDFTQDFDGGSYFLEEDTATGWWQYRALLAGDNFSNGVQSATMSFAFGGLGEAYLDDVSLICANGACSASPPPVGVPEPGSLLLAGAALAALGLVRRRRSA